MRRNNLGGLFLHGNAGAKMTTETENHVLDRVLELLAVRAKSKGPLKSDTRILADTNLDSVSVMDFVLELEDEFDVTIPLNQLADVETVGDLTDAVQKLRENS